MREYRDHFGNDVHHFDVLESHDRLAVTAVSEVWTPQTLVADRREPTPLELHDYLSPTEHAPFAQAIEDFVEGHTANGGVLARARELMDAVHAELVYEPGATDVQTRADEVLALGRGVCQDFAHVLLAACRSVGIPARYVSGYLYDPTLLGDNAASHAWVDVWDEAQGWIALDPTHDREQTEAYVRVAVGRDYSGRATDARRLHGHRRTRRSASGSGYRRSRGLMRISRTHGWWARRGALRPDPAWT